jgi:hypothetical protein
MTQKLLWVIDETQARWEALLAHHPDLQHAEIMWSKDKNNIKDGVKVIGALIGARPRNVTPTTKVHAGDKSESDKLRAAVLAQDMIYRKKMGINNTEYELEHFDIAHPYEGYRKPRKIIPSNGSQAVADVSISKPKAKPNALLGSVA